MKINQLLSEISADDIKKHLHQLIGSNLNKCQLIVTNPNVRYQLMILKTETSADWFKFKEISADCYKSKCTPKTTNCMKQKTKNIFFTFQYICYPWKNDDQIDPKNRRKTCRSI